MVKSRAAPPEMSGQTTNTTEPKQIAPMKVNLKTDHKVLLFVAERNNDERDYARHRIRLLILED